MPASRGEFDRSREVIEAKVIELFAMIAEDLPRAAEALAGGHGETARVLAEREQLIDALYLEIENLASREILLQAPVASDLRFLLSVLRITPELERSHDLVMDGDDPGSTLLPAPRRARRQHRPPGHLPRGTGSGIACPAAPAAGTSTGKPGSGTSGCPQGVSVVLREFPTEYAGSSLRIRLTALRRTCYSG